MKFLNLNIIFIEGKKILIFIGFSFLFNIVNVISERKKLLEFLN